MIAHMELGARKVPNRCEGGVTFAKVARAQRNDVPFEKRDTDGTSPGPLMAPPCWRTALARGIEQSLSRPISAPQPYLVTRKLPNGLGTLHMAAARLLSKRSPGNGGLRLWKYATSDAASDEATRLGMGMSVKHDTFNTGFAGAKLVCAAESSPSSWSPSDKKVLLDEVQALLEDQDGAMYTGW